MTNIRETRKKHHITSFIRLPAISVTYMGVSKNNGIPKSSNLIGFFIIFTIHFGGFPPIFRNIQYITKILNIAKTYAAFMRTHWINSQVFQGSQQIIFPIFVAPGLFNQMFSVVLGWVGLVTCLWQVKLNHLVLYNHMLFTHFLAGVDWKFMESHKPLAKHTLPIFFVAPENRPSPKWTLYFLNHQFSGVFAVGFGESILGFA